MNTLQKLIGYISLAMVEVHKLVEIEEDTDERQSLYSIENYLFDAVKVIGDLKSVKAQFE